LRPAQKTSPLAFITHVCSSPVQTCGRIGGGLAAFVAFEAVVAALVVPDEVLASRSPPQLAHIHIPITHAQRFPVMSASPCGAHVPRA
jgi:hypothetical protein